MSNHLDDIIAKQHGATNVLVVFLDVIKYSLRKSVMQQRIINAFNDTLQQACDDISKKYALEAQKRTINFATDIIKIPTGDGAAIVFPFEGLQDIHLHFAISFLKFVVSSRQNVECPIFLENGWCNCHNFFDARIGISDGKGIVFKDINKNYNIAGNPVNFANRVMTLGDRNQILLTVDAYRNLIDMTEDTELESKFVDHGPVEVKHDITLGIYQYVGADDKFLNIETPLLVNMAQQIKKMKENPIFRNIAMPNSQSDLIQQTERMSKMFRIMASSKGDLSGLTQFIQMVTSGNPEDMDSLEEFFTTRSKLSEITEKLFRSPLNEEG